MSRPKRPVDRATGSRASYDSQTASRHPSQGTSHPSASARPSSVPRSSASARPSSAPRSSASARPSSAPRSSASARPSSAPRSSASARPSSAPRSSASARPSTASRPVSTARAGSSSRPITTSRPPASSARPSATPASSGSSRPSKPTASQKRPPSNHRPTKRKRMRPRWGRWIALLLVIGLCVKFVPPLFDRFAPEDEVVTTVQSVTQPLVSDTDKPGFDETINSDSAIIINVGNGDILYEKDADTQRAPASLVKMMTVYVAIKHCDDIDRELQMPKDAYKGLEENRASQSGLKAGETVTVRDLLYAAMLESGGDAANALALVTSGNIKGFVDLMNEEAKHMGLDSTVFKNPTGLDAEGQVSTCRDMARLVKGALGNSVFKEVFTTQKFTTTANDTHQKGVDLTHTMMKDLNTFQRYFVTSGYSIIGGKTGYTETAGNCLVTLSYKEKAPEFVVVTMHATGTGDQYYQAFHDAVTLYGEAYEQIKQAPAEKDGSH